MSDIRQTHAPAVEPEPIYTAGEITDPAFYRVDGQPLVEPCHITTVVLGAGGSPVSAVCAIEGRCQYGEVEQERDQYQKAWHDAEARLRAEVTARQQAEQELARLQRGEAK